MTGRPHKWPWLEVAVGDSFILFAHSVQSARASVSRAKRLYKVTYTIETQRNFRDKANRYVLRRVR